MNPDTIGCVWTDEFDLNTLRVDGEIFESRKKKLRIQKYRDACKRNLRNHDGDVEDNGNQKNFISYQRICPKVILYLLITVKTKTQLNLGQIDKFETKIRKISRRG